MEAVPPGSVAKEKPETELTIVIGGPEVSFECDQQEIVRMADYVITGEADLAFGQLCAQLIAGEAPPLKIIAAPLPAFEQPSASATMPMSAVARVAIPGPSLDIRCAERW